VTGAQPVDGDQIWPPIESQVVHFPVDGSHPDAGVVGIEPHTPPVVQLSSGAVKGIYFVVYIRRLNVEDSLRNQVVALLPLPIVE
jgi:hypothetical protein